MRLAPLIRSFHPVGSGRSCANPRVVRCPKGCARACRHHNAAHRPLHLRHPGACAGGRWRSGSSKPSDHRYHGPACSCRHADTFPAQPPSCRSAERRRTTRFALLPVPTGPSRWRKCVILHRYVFSLPLPRSRWPPPLPCPHWSLPAAGARLEYCVQVYLSICSSNVTRRGAVGARKASPHWQTAGWAATRDSRPPAHRALLAQSCRVGGPRERLLAPL